MAYDLHQRIAQLELRRLRIVEAQQPAAARDGDHRRSRTWLTEELHLTPAQAAAVDSIVERRHREMRAVIAPVRPQMDAVRDTARQQIRRVLDDAQRARFDELIAKKNSERKK